MKIFNLLPVLFILAANCAFGQSFTYPDMVKNAKNGNDFVPAGWNILSQAKGDLNHDGTIDIALVLEYKDTVSIVKDEDTISTQPRILLILFRNPGSTNYSLVQQSNTFILPGDRRYMDDPLQSIKIINGVLHIDFNISYSMGSWYADVYNYKFRYHNNQFELIGADVYSMHRASHDYTKYSYDFLTRKRVLISGNEERSRKEVHTKILDTHKLMCLSTLIKPFSWEVEPDVFL
jgi:hypothetical protein